MDVCNMTKKVTVEGYKEYLHDIINYDGILRETVGVLLGEAKAIYRGGPLGSDEIRKYEAITIFNEAGNIALHYHIQYFVDENGEKFVIRKR